MCEHKLTDFSIETLLKKDTKREVVETPFDWLACTRYRPPKLQRVRKDSRGLKKLNRSARVPFSNAEIGALETHYSQSPYLSSRDVANLAQSLNITESRVKIWFQNRRARDRRDNEGKRPQTSSVSDEDSVSDKKNDHSHTQPDPEIPPLFYAAYAQYQAIFGSIVSGLK